MNQQSIHVLKFGSSVLHGPQDMGRAASEVLHYVHGGQRTVVIVSALEGQTDRLLGFGQNVSSSASSQFLPELIATGEHESALLLAMALEEFDCDPFVETPEEVGLIADGSTLDANLTDVDDDALLRRLNAHPVVILPGFVGVDSNGQRKLLGRGGSDLTAVFIAQRMNARCTLIKDVDGIFDHDPATHGTKAKKFSKISWNDTLKVAGELVQEKAIYHARKHRFEFKVSSIGSSGGSLVGAATLLPEATSSVPNSRQAAFSPGS